MAAYHDADLPESHKEHLLCAAGREGERRRRWCGTTRDKGVPCSSAKEGVAPCGSQIQTGHNSRVKDSTARNVSFVLRSVFLWYICQVAFTHPLRQLICVSLRVFFTRDSECWYVCFGFDMITEDNCNKCLVLNHITTRFVSLSPNHLLICLMPSHIIDLILSMTCVNCAKILAWVKADKYSDL